MSLMMDQIDLILLLCFLYLLYLIVAAVRNHLAKKRAGKEIKQNEGEQPLLAPCPACGKNVSKNAAACPNCGEPAKKEDLFLEEVKQEETKKPTGSSKNGKLKTSNNVGCGGMIIAALVVMVMLFIHRNDMPPTSATKSSSQQLLTSSPQKQPTAETFPFTVDQFLAKLAYVYKKVDIPLNYRIETTYKNGVIITSITINKHSALSIKSLEGSNRVEDVIFMGSGDGTLNSGADVLINSSLVASAIIDPEMSKEERGRLVMKIGQGTHGKTTFTYQGVSISSELIQRIGFWVIIAPNHTGKLGDNPKTDDHYENGKNSSSGPVNDRNTIWKDADGLYHN